MENIPLFDGVFSLLQQNKFMEKNLKYIFAELFAAVVGGE